MWLPKLRKNMNIVRTGVNIKQFDETTFKSLHMKLLDLVIRSSIITMKIDH